ncbi:MAG: 50S ribosomal protein L22 [Sodaliphilus pleomorphus]|jgi:large subunit ribosomal protein L22|uniref:50S ribosomal protein L22 n=1 Tax=Sodaliphilus pleomorphus TaxID=2606626 RepID=UPI0023F3E138|nr:50S ribosomal protein L22 [Sodaliphilus pleomorphus]MDD7066824.1 50S ribosomal protein L22 [Sodaliphilus pleomorphus]MDY2833066.1 50S ribosomal protein L22 [Sodaliphilus pleomorphus]
MGKRKRETANKIKEARRELTFAKLKNVPSSPRKMRLVADMVRGVEVFKALGLLHFSNKQAAVDVEKLLKSAISNWEQKNGKKAENGELYIKTITVDCAPMLKRLRPDSKGRGYRIRKRSNHITLYVDTINKDTKDA